jgi:hypothetical protein
MEQRLPHEGRPGTSRAVLSEAGALEVLAYLVTATRTQVDEAAEYGPMRLLTAARLLAEQLPAPAGASGRSATDLLLRELRATEPTATPTRDRDEYVAGLDALCELVADALLDLEGRHATVREAS